jgi:hypothetical protein
LPKNSSTGAQARLAGDERSAPGGAGLFGVIVGKQHAFLGDAVDIGRVIAHQSMRVARQVRLPDIVAPDDEDIRLLCVLRHDGIPLPLRSAPGARWRDNAFMVAW